MKSYKTCQLIVASLSLPVLLACNAALAVFEPTPTPVPPTMTALTVTPSISQQVMLESVPFHEENPGGSFPPYRITAQTPRLGGSSDPRVGAFNARLNELVTREVESHRQNFQQLPITSLSNGSFLDISYTLVAQLGDLWSLKLDFSFYADTAAHPGSYSLTVNYDLARGRELALADLFLPGSNYLQVISDDCTAQLRERFYGDSSFLDGAGPAPENYRSWNIAPDGLLITFDEYQVAPYAAGPQQVTVAYSKLQPVIDPQGPLADIAP